MSLAVFAALVCWVTSCLAPSKPWYWPPGTIEGFMIPQSAASKPRPQTSPWRQGPYWKASAFSFPVSPGMRRQGFGKLGHPTGPVARISAEANRSVRAGNRCRTRKTDMPIALMQRADGGPGGPARPPGPVAGRAVNARYEKAGFSRPWDGGFLFLGCPASPAWRWAGPHANPTHRPTSRRFTVCLGPLLAGSRSTDGHGRGQCRQI